MSKSKILVTGGAGYIASHVCKQLFLQGYTPIVLDNLSVGHRYAVKWGPFIHGDIKNKKIVDSVLKTYSPDAVMHFAADALIGESVINPGKYYHNNVSGTITLIRSMIDHGVKNFIFSSSCATYGNPIQLPIDEKHPQRPINPYGRSKLMIEQALDDFMQAHPFHYATLRYFNAAGADFDGEIGENHLNETHLIPLVLSAAYYDREIKIFGNDFDTKDKTAIRDYIHVVDLVDAHIKALKWVLTNQSNLCVNLGSGRGYSVKEIILAVEKICQKSIKTKITSRRRGDPSVLIADNKKALAKLSWTAKYSDIHTIINSAWQWYQKTKKEKFSYENLYSNE